MSRQLTGLSICNENMSIMKEKSHKCVAVGSGKATTSKTGAVITIPHKSHATSTRVTKIQMLIEISKFND